MATDRALILRGFLRSAVKNAAAQAKTPKEVLEALLVDKFTVDASDGRTVVSTSEAGGSVTFMVPYGFGASEVMALAEEAIEWLEMQPDPNNPVLCKRRIKRLRAGFDRAVI